MKQLFNDFFDRYFHDEESVILVILLVSALAVLLMIGELLAPLITAIIIAYLMQGLVDLLLKHGVPAKLAFVLVYAFFVSTFLLILLILLPQVWNQLTRMVTEIPNLLSQWRASLMLLPENYPSLVTEQMIADLIDTISREFATYTQVVVGYSLASIPSILGWLVFLVLVPILVFFVMKDNDLLVAWAGNFLPRNRPLMSRIWREMDEQIANYIRGKVVEILIVGATSYLAFVILGINYALLLSVLVGLSVIVPYIGAVVVAFPIAAVAYVQWGGLASEFYTVLVVYGVLQLIDGNVLAPIIFSETVNLHPIAIIVAVLVFGGIWGLAGVFFAIPLATLIKAILNAWPSRVSKKHTRPVKKAANVDLESS